MSNEMCLIAKINGGKKVAKEDIICYKVLIKNKEGYYLTPITHYDCTKAIVGCRYISLHDNNIEPELSDDNNYYIIDEGFIHTFDSLDDASVFISTICHEKGKNVDSEGNVYHIFRCIIPKGELYYTNVRKKGDGGFNASKFIKIKMDVTKNYLNPTLNNPDR